MLITNTTVTKQATGETSNARYKFEYTITENRLTRVLASVFELQLDENGNEVFLGNISLENDIVNCSLPQKCRITPLFEDFESFMVQIQVDSKDLTSPETQLK